MLKTNTRTSRGSDIRRPPAPNGLPERVARTATAPYSATRADEMAMYQSPISCRRLRTRHQRRETALGIAGMVTGGNQGLGNTDFGIRPRNKATCLNALSSSTSGRALASPTSIDSDTKRARRIEASDVVLKSEARSPAGHPGFSMPRHPPIKIS